MLDEPQMAQAIWPVAATVVSASSPRLAARRTAERKLVVHATIWSSWVIRERRSLGVVFWPPKRKIVLYVGNYLGNDLFLWLKVFSMVNDPVCLVASLARPG